jgi:hypothetical protein
MIFQETLTKKEREKCCWIINNINNFSIEEGDNRLCIYFDGGITIYMDGTEVTPSKARKEPALKILVELYDECVDFCGEDLKPSRPQEVNFLKAYLFLEEKVKEINCVVFIPDLYYNLVDIPEGME